MPKERFHLYIADRIVDRCGARFPSDGLNPAPDLEMKEGGCAELKDAALIPGQGPLSSSLFPFFIGSISPDILFYDVPSFSLSPVGDALHDLIDRNGISIIYEWVAKSSSKKGEGSLSEYGNVRGKETLNDSGHLTKRLWALGVACHFLVDAAWHPVIEQLSGRGSILWGEGVKREDCNAFHYGIPSVDVRCKGSEIECHRLIESELEALWLPKSPGPGKFGDLLKTFRKSRKVLFEIAFHYRRFLEFAGILPRYGIVYPAAVFEKRLVNCFLWQNFLLEVFANKLLGRIRDCLLSFPPAYGLAVLVTPSQPVLPALFSTIFTKNRNPFSDCFMEQAISSIEQQLCEFSENLP